ncbi:MAG: thioredoxin [Thaumarchaeota archaeon]|nr:thioredoxin [Nitrososphaerota archaeon]
MSDPELEKILNEKARRMTLEASSKHAPTVALTSSDFDRYVNDGRPVFVDFWAVWCGPCKTMEPVVDRLSAKYAGKVLFGKLNVDEQPGIATRYEVQSIPTFMIFKKGQPVDAAIGAVGELALDRLIQRSLNGAGPYR